MRYKYICIEGMQFSNIPDQDIVIKNVTFQDIPRIIELQKESFPSMLEEGSVWGKEASAKSRGNISRRSILC